MTHNEALSRIKISLLLEEAGWRFFDTAERKANILLKNHVKITQKVVDAGVAILRRWLWITNPQQRGKLVQIL